MTEDAKWKQEAEHYANGVGESSMKVHHESITKCLGHDIKVVFDWNSFNRSDWTKTGGVGPYCVGDTLGDIASICDDQRLSLYTPYLAKIKTITCRYKPDAQLPRDVAGDKAPGVEYKWTKDGTNLDTSFCEKSASFTGPGGISPRKFLLDSLTEPKLATWHKQSEDKANGRGDMQYTADQQIKSTHDDLVKCLGHDINVVFNWKNFNIDDWKGADTAGYCIGDDLRTIVDMCNDEQYHKGFKPKLAKIKTFTCHYKACEQLPREIKGSKNPGVEYKISADKSNIDHSFCIKSATVVGPGGIHFRDFLDKTFKSAN
jgi:hypothetical protein